MQMIMNLVPEKYFPYLRLIRFDSHTGTLLLLFPCLWSLILASETFPKPWIFIIFIVGSFLMRSSGCIINDIIDKDIDKLVARTFNRPLSSGELSVKQALTFLSCLLVVSLFLLLLLNKLTIVIGLLAIIPVVIYPFMKRFFNYPQAFLGITFNIGSLMAYSAIKDRIDLTAICLYVGACFWTMGYDTIYAHQDIEDDRKQGLKSTAITFGKDSHTFITFCYKAAAISIFLAAILSKINILFCLLLLIPFAHLFWQVRNVDLDNPGNCGKRFKSNVVFGLLVTVVLVVCRVF
jgi:4-hydroxybenzoate polyprenyl transferase